MPIKIPKGFQRRKSSGNVLDEVPATEPSFKVFTRPNSEQKSVDMNLNRQKPLPAQRNSFEQEDDDLFTVMRPDAANRGSGGTANSLSTAPYDSAASSTRLSSSSTIPSSIDARSDKNVQPSTQAYHHVESSAPAPPPHQHKPSGFLRNAGRTFSFGKATPETPASPPPPVPSISTAKGRFSFSHGRDRAPTVSSVSTTTAPRLLESDLSLENSELDFGNMFAGIGAKSREPSPSRPLQGQGAISPTGRQTHPENTYMTRSVPPHPISIDRSAHIESSPYSVNSDNSRDGLMQTPSSANTIVHNSPQLNSGRAFGKPMSQTISLQQVEPTADDNMFAGTPSRARASSRASKQNVPSSAFVPAPNRHLASSHSTRTTIQNSPIPEREDLVFDPSLLANAALASKYEETKAISNVPATPSSKKVMTPAQFERYKQQQDERHRMNKVFKNTHESDESDDNYDDVEEDDETERDRQAAKQRRKQEAHLAVYRQTMMKVTGEQAAPTPRVNTTYQAAAASQSATDLANQFSAIGFDKSPARSSEDEDDDVPLGILAAHGFPNKNRPPTRLSSSTSNPNLRGVIPPQPGPGSVAGESAKRGSLPVFARHLPEDPYYGASLVNQSNRESMAMHSSSNFVPSGASTAHPHHPAGLVGVIAGEERARAMRRGSPNAATGTYDLPPSMPGHPGHPALPRSQTTGSMPNLMVPGMPGMMGMPPMPGMLSPGDHAQIQMSQQMTQMMQMQMQWMQQMQQMMANQGVQGSMPQMSQAPQIPPMPVNLQAGLNMQRPQSVPLQGHPAQEQRTMSMLNPPSMAGWNNAAPSVRGGPQSIYAPSIAPSERSNIGLASRYRPVSTIQEPERPYNKRASTMTSTTFRPLSTFGGLGVKQPASTVRKVAASADDEDDEQGWAEMKAKKDQKKKTWKLRKGQNVLQELYNGTS